MDPFNGERAIHEGLDMVTAMLRQEAYRQVALAGGDLAGDRRHLELGGGALLRGIDKVIEERTGLTVRIAEDPLTCVVRGTGRILDDPLKYQSVLSK